MLGDGTVAGAVPHPFTATYREDKDMEQMTLEQYDGIAEAFEKAEESTIPFPIVNGDELTVVGDANETQIIKQNFTIRFTVPQEQEDGSVKYTAVNKDYKNVFIKPRQRAKVVQHIVGMRPFYDKITADGGVEKLSQEERISVLANMGEDVMDHMYDLVALVLGIDTELKDYMEPLSVIQATTAIIVAYTDMVNEADVFFDRSPGRQ